MAEGLDRFLFHESLLDEGIHLYSGTNPNASQITGWCFSMSPAQTIRDQPHSNGKYNPS